MRKLMIIASLLISSQAFAFTDLLTVHQTKNLIARVKMENTLERKNQALENYKEWLSSRLNSFEMPEDPLQASDELAQEFASLNEFESYVQMINIGKLNQRSCAASKARIQSATGLSQDQLDKGVIVSEALLAQEIINAICQ